MTTWFDVDGVRKRMAVYTGSGDDNPMANPLGNLSRIKIHSDLQYIGFVPARTITRTISIPQTQSGRERLIQIGSHGQPGVPYCKGFVNVGGILRPLIGSVPVYNNGDGECIIWTLGVSASNIVIHELRSKPTPQPFTGSSRGVTIYVSSKIMGT